MERLEKRHEKPFTLQSDIFCLLSSLLGNKWSYSLNKETTFNTTQIFIQIVYLLVIVIKIGNDYKLN